MMNQRILSIWQLVVVVWNWLSEGRKKQTEGSSKVGIDGLKENGICRKEISLRVNKNLRVLWTIPTSLQSLLLAVRIFWSSFMDL
jgi:hypothetical protein